MMSKSQAANIRKLAYVGFQNPRVIPPYLLSKLFPQRTRTWFRKGDNITFELGGFTSSPRNRPEFAANIYYEANCLIDVLQQNIETPVSRSLEVGCGYGRLSPWIAKYSEQHTAVDINDDAIGYAQGQYPEIEFSEESVTSLPFDDDSFNFTVTWTVLQHIPEKRIEEATRELASVTSNTLIICEKSQGCSGEHVWTRTPEEYDDLFSGFELSNVEPRVVEPTFRESLGEEVCEEVMVFTSN